MSAGPVRVLVADDQLPFRRAARAVLDAMPEFELVGEAESGEEAVAEASRLEPDLVLMDVHMAGIGGIEATRRILIAQPGAALILVSSYRAEDLTVAAAESGALAFLPKDQFGARALTELWTSRGAPRARTRRREPPSPGD